ncbi:MAG: peptide-methionine (R)-S-oxide reductase [Phenylobacterium sp. RIFCSPHIGHO2_01_FULL_69_31]|jgi:peptide-methionine (R)-S-oxide reductase|uniref:peptide-methionine (R)-S-oxide reductase MsrB n=1 Tax=Phenylobacterium sp. RIFCSPHIGHO2_01_FULL_69_31 TaxID=1801944 RepID=UPI0008ABDC10|nr:peptide-methionine (R)-S-oxide reductase MsrB [Phenylobacterium sp. RIFCSPHIGHO2_01_FULL_69_31]OHB28196.1 MAG: peptide-methionine (R)-S-oxide reductase [Phenylobacterium sp. RIFCSPHIGHO2_01_FULL_69_31]
MSTMSLDRRGFLAAASALAIAVPTSSLAAARDAYANSPYRKITDAEWRKRLPAASYRILRHEDTERPGSSPLLKEKRKGTFACLGCGLPLFSSTTKYESGTGWPSFYRALPGALATKTDHKIGVPRTEYHCAQCLGHQGHVFDDGPRPTGLRYCNNGFALKFVPA